MVQPTRRHRHQQQQQHDHSHNSGDNTLRETQPTTHTAGAHDISSADNDLAARAILDELNTVLCEASARGVDLAASFAHFDRRHDGLVGVDAFMTAVVELRIGSTAPRQLQQQQRLWDESDIERCIERISHHKSRAYFTRADFVQFFTAAAAAASTATSERNENRHTQQQQQHRHGTNSTSNSNKPKTTALKLVKPSSKTQPQQQRSSNNDAPVFASLDSRVRVGVASSSSSAINRTTKQQTTTATVSLPTWATTRSKRALHELELLQRRAKRLPQATSMDFQSLCPNNPLDAHDDSSSSSDEQQTHQTQPTGIQRLQLPRSDLQTAATSNNNVLDVVDDDDDDAAAAATQWQRSFVVDADTTLSYAILSHANALSSTTTADDSDATTDASHATTTALDDTAFRFTVFLDAFQTLATLAAFFQPLLLQFPRGKILLCGPPTRTRRQTLWTSHYSAQAFAKLVLYLIQTTREWLVQPKVGIAAMPQFVIAFGSSGATALAFLTTAIAAAQTPLLQLFVRAQRGLILLNALVETTDSARYALQQLKRLAFGSCRGTTSHVELHEALVQRLWSSFYLTQVAPNRRNVLEQFFQTRKRFLNARHCELLGHLLHGCVKSASSTQSALAALQALEAPFALIVVHGTQNALFAADQVACLTDAWPPEAIARSLPACLAVYPQETTADDDDVRQSPQLHVAWLKSGHEVLQERPTFVHDLFRQLVQVDVAATAMSRKQNDEASAAQGESTANANDSVVHVANASGERASVATSQSTLAPAPVLYQMTSDALDRGSSSTADAQPTAAVETAPADVTAHVQLLLQQHGIKWIQQELYDRGVEGSGTTATILLHYARVLAEEAAQAHSKQLHAAQQRAKQDAFDTHKRAQQADKLAQQAQAHDVQQRIAARERETQRAFFAQIEQEKHLQTRVAMELEAMALEDVYAQRIEAQATDVDKRHDRNRAMTRQVEALAIERRELAREQFQIELQRTRLAEQQRTRDALKRAQRAFEQHELVTSPVEAYALDVAPVWSNFHALAAGARVLATDVAHLHALKAAQIDDASHKRVAVENSKATIAALELAVRNIERVVLKATATGMIARAGLGTVRIVSISPVELETLQRDCDAKQDALARAQHALTLEIHALAWTDTLLQRLSELIKRNDAFRTETLARLATCVDSGNELLLRAREDGEELREQLARNAAVAARCVIRRSGVDDESARARAATTEFFDTRLRVEGTTQRVMRLTLLREHDAEIQVLDAKLHETQALATALDAQIEANDATLHAFGEATFDVEQSRLILERATTASDAQANRASLDGSSGTAASGDLNDVSNTNSADGVDVDANGVLRVRLERADAVRQKLHVHRTAEEKRWVTLDFCLHMAHYYKCIDATEVELIARHPDYQQPPRRHRVDAGNSDETDTNDVRTLTKDQLERLLTLPARNCLALAFLKTPAELEAHYLLRKYSCGDGEAYFASVDAAFAAAGASKAAIVVQALDDLAATVETASTRGRSAGWCIDRGRSALLEEAHTPPLSLLSVSQSELQPHASATHAFRLPTTGVGVLSLTVSIVFQGHFRSTGYQNGRLAGMLYVLPSPLPSTQPQPLSRAPVAVGQCFYARDIALCTPHSLGKLVLRHEPRMKPLCADATYQVVVGSPVFTAYSIQVTAHTALLASEVLRVKRADALTKQLLLPQRHDAIENVFVTIELSERKKRLAQTLAHDAKDAARAAELEMLRATKQLEDDSVAAVSHLGHDARAALHLTIQQSEQRFTDACFRYTKREDEARDVDAALHELTRVHADLLDDVAAIERDLAAYRAHLPRLAASLVDSDDVRDADAAGATLAIELGGTYDSERAKAGRVRWAELAAMKAKLPSMMTPAERLRRKYKKGVDVLEKTERAWIVLDRIVHPRLYDWEATRLVGASSGVSSSTAEWRMRLYGAHPKLSKDEEQLATLSQMEVHRILNAPWNVLERKEIQIRKIVTKYRDDRSSNNSRTSHTSASTPPSTIVALLRTQLTTELTAEECEWRSYDQLLHPSCYPLNATKLMSELRAVAAQAMPDKSFLNSTISQSVTREALVTALSTPDAELYKLSSDHLRARTLLLKFDPQLNTNIVTAAAGRATQTTTAPATNVLDMDVDARCRLVYHELQRAVANTRNEFMDSCVLHATLQRFPTKVLRLELEKELDRLLVAQIYEREAFELRTFLANAKGDATRTRRALALDASAMRRKTKGGGGGDGDISDSDAVSSSDSDDEAQIAREAHAQQRAKAAGSKSTKGVRGKALKQKSLQKQRREIQDALKGRSLEERQLLLQEQELGVGGCLACRTNPCTWSLYLEASTPTIERRIKVLQTELERVKRCSDLTLTSSVCLAALNAHTSSRIDSSNEDNIPTITMRKADLLDDVTTELKMWQRHLHLQAVDREFHATFCTKDAFVQTQALHGFVQTQQRVKVQHALAREHDKLVALVVTSEVVDDLLASMLEGWIFGERESTRQVLGFVPSIKRDGPLTLHDLRVLEQSERLASASTAAVARVEERSESQGDPLTKWQPIQVAAFAVDFETKAVARGSALDKSLTETENALKFGLFCMTLMYFRGLSMLKKQRQLWATPSAVAGTKKQAQRLQQTAHPRQQPTTLSSERQRMDLEATNVTTRQDRAAVFDAKAHRGQTRKQRLADQQTAAYRQRLVVEHQHATRERRAAVEIQRVFRGFVGRCAGRKWMLRRREIDAVSKLQHAAAVSLQRAYRGRLGRLAAEAKRVELAEFISQLRAEEAIVEEEDYWQKHGIERAARRVAAFIKREA